jgi:hypothetical protein
MNNTLIPPAKVVVSALGGVRAAARLLECDASTVSRWQVSGRVPSSWQRRVLELAWSKGIDLTAHDVIFGRRTA